MTEEPGVGGMWPPGPGLTFSWRLRSCCRCSACCSVTCCLKSWYFSCRCPCSMLHTTASRAAGREHSAVTTTRPRLQPPQLPSPGPLRPPPPPPSPVHLVAGCGSC